MQKFMKKRKARGFTLVELLIVIIIIGILAGALLLAAGAGTDKANATKIVSNMRGIKTAAVMKYADDGNWDWVDSDIENISDVTDYMDRDPNDSNLVSYDITGTDSNSYIWVVAGAESGTGAIPGNGTNVTGVAEKLANMAEEVGLYKDTTPASGDENISYYDGGAAAYMRIK
jgi:general secretion pathway protein G